MHLNIEVPAVALAIAAHPDDAEFGCGATLAKWSAAGTTVHHLVCTDGSKGSWDPKQDSAMLVATRQHEQMAAASALGCVGDCVFLSWIDGELESGLRQRSDVAYWIRKLRPDVILGHDPWKRWRLHPDHRHAGFLAVEGVVAARDPHFFPEHDLAHHRPRAMLLWEADEVDHVEDVSGFASAKLAGLLEHKSQFRSTHHIDDPKDERQLADFRDRLDKRLSEMGSYAGLSQGEAFKLIDSI